MYKHKIYFLIGTPRSGTTYLYNVLKKNNKINILPKENHFFLNLQNNTMYNSKLDPPKLKKNTSINYYLNLLDKNKVNYDINTLYFYDLNALRFIKKNFPNSKFFCILRDPVSRHFSHCLTQIKKYYMYNDIGEFNFPISDFYNLKKSILFKNYMLNLSNYKYNKKILKINRIKCDYYIYENLISKKSNYKNFLKKIGINSFDKNLIYGKHSNKDYPIKLFATKIGKIKSKFFKKVYVNKVNQTIYNFKHNYPFKLMKKIFISNEKNLENIYRNLISIKIDE